MPACHSNWAATYFLMKRDGKTEPDCTVDGRFSCQTLPPDAFRRSDPSACPSGGTKDDRATVEAELPPTTGRATCRGTFVALKKAIRRSSLVIRVRSPHGKGLCRAASIIRIEFRFSSQMIFIPIEGLTHVRVRTQKTFPFAVKLVARPSLSIQPSALPQFREVMTSERA